MSAPGAPIPAGGGGSDGFSRWAVSGVSLRACGTAGLGGDGAEAGAGGVVGGAWREAWSSRASARRLRRHTTRVTAAAQHRDPVVLELTDAPEQDS
ncbi:hypothetical protein [Streptomyces anulatus]|uniref:hypothetical protein n=1 Tax=Streptomyces anulatus TaxID=1892 RepID=UPI00341F1C68